MAGSVRLTIICENTVGRPLPLLGEPQFRATLDYLETLEPVRIGVGHCTGQTRAALLKERFPDRVFFTPVGTVVEF